MKYHVKVKTGDDEDAGTDDKIYLQIFGNNGETESLLLDTTHASTNRFEPMQTSEFDLDALNVGQVLNFELSLYSHFKLVTSNRLIFLP